MQAEVAATRRTTTVFGPILMIAFGVVLAMTPLASVSGLGTVGNAGSAGKQVDCIEVDDGEHGNNGDDGDAGTGGGGVVIVAAAGALPEPCEDDVTDPSSTLPAASSTSIVTPVECDEDGNALGDYPDEWCADWADEVAAETTAAAAPQLPTPPAPAPAQRQPSRLPATGADGRSVTLTLTGLAFAAGGVALLIVGRRPARR